MKKQFLEVGKIVTTHGIKGEVKVEPWCDDGEFLCSFSKVFLKNGAQQIKVLSSRVQKNMVIMQLEGINSIDEAKTFCGKVLYIDRNDAVLPDKRYFIDDLMGADIIDANIKKCYGKLTDVLKTGANDVYEVTAKNDRKYLLPAIPDVVKDIDVESGIIKITPLKGIFDDEN